MLGSRGGPGIRRRHVLLAVALLHRTARRRGRRGRDGVGSGGALGRGQRRGQAQHVGAGRRGDGDALGVVAVAQAADLRLQRGHVGLRVVREQGGATGFIVRSSTTRPEASHRETNV